MFSIFKKIFSKRLKKYFENLKKMFLITGKIFGKFKIKIMFPQFISKKYFQVLKLLQKNVFEIAKKSFESFWKEY